MDVKIVKKMSLAYAGYISKILTLVSPFSLQISAKHNLNSNKMQNTQVYITKPTGLSWKQK